MRLCILLARPFFLACSGVCILVFVFGTAAVEIYLDIGLVVVLFVMKNPLYFGAWCVVCN